jgi:hypothetical protein
VLDDTLLLGSRVQIPGQQELLNEWNSGGYQHENYGHVRLGGEGGSGMQKRGWDHLLAPIFICTLLSSRRYHRFIPRVKTPQCGA